MFAASKSPVELPVSELGIAAARSVFDSPGHGAAIGVFRRSCYCQTPAGALICIADRGSGAGPITLSVDLSPSMVLEDLGIIPGTPLEIRDSRIYLGNRLILSLESAKVWQPMPLEAPASAAVIRTRLIDLAADLSKLAPKTGLAPLLPHAAQLAQGRIPQIPDPELLAGLAAPRVSRLSQCLMDHDVGTIDEAVLSLTGLGPGLTPSGDDLLAGLMVALEASAAPRWMCSSLAKSVQAHAQTGTNRISQALLEQAAEGRGSEAEHRFLSHLLGSTTQDLVAASAIALTRVGHTSGWDSLVGLMLGTHLGLALPQQNNAPLPLVPAGSDP